MKKTYLHMALLLVVLLTACQPPANTPLPSPTAAPPPTDTPAPALTATPTLAVEPVVVAAVCTLMKRDPVTQVPAGRPIVLRWGWNAATKDQIQDYLDTATTKVTLDGQTVIGPLVDNMKWRDEGKYYYIAWEANVGALSLGSHTVTYSASWSKQIYDGQDTYGPGGKIETLQDKCEIVVQ